MKEFEGKSADYKEGYADAVEEILDELHSALHGGDLEHGVAWLNDKAAADFAKSYPCLSQFVDWLRGLEIDLLEEEENEQ